MLLTDRDWNAEWIQLQKAREWDDTPEYWNGRSAEFAKCARQSSYAGRFLEYAAIPAGATVLDVGCGPGTLTLPLARSGHQVTAVDFADGMLAHLEEQASREGLAGIRTVKAGWEDDWGAFGIDCADVAVASRSIATPDLGAALEKLHLAARQKVCLTVAAGSSPRHDARIFRALGREYAPEFGHVYCMNILFRMGVMPELRYVRSEKPEFFDSRDEARASVERMIGSVRPHEEGRLDQYLAEHLVRVTRVSDDEHWTWNQPRTVAWAFISWKTRQQS